MSKYDPVSLEIEFFVPGVGDFAAEVEYFPVIPGRFSGPPEDCYPDEGGDLDFISLCTEGDDAMWMLKREHRKAIYSAARDAAEKALAAAQEYEP